MAYSSIIDVLKGILSEKIDNGIFPILALAKTDQEKRKEVDHDSETEETTQYSWSKSEKTAWLRQSYTKPVAAAGVRTASYNRTTLNATASIASKATPEEIECERARERRLRRQATQGVVALFNAVKDHQKNVEHQLNASGPLVFKKEKVLTDLTASDFLDRLSVGLPGAKPKTLKSFQVAQDLGPMETSVATKRKLPSFPLTTYSVKIQKG